MATFRTGYFDNALNTYASHDDYYPWNPIEDDSYVEFQEFDNACFGAPCEVCGVAA